MVSSLRFVHRRQQRISARSRRLRCATIDWRIGCGIAPCQDVAERLARDALVGRHLPSRPGRSESSANPGPSCGIWPRFTASTNAEIGRCDWSLHTAIPACCSSTKSCPAIDETTTARTPCSASRRTRSAQPLSSGAGAGMTVALVAPPSLIFTNVKHAQPPKCADNEAPGPPEPLLGKAIRPSMT